MNLMFKILVLGFFLCLLSCQEDNTQTKSKKHGRSLTLVKPIERLNNFDPSKIRISENIITYGASLEALVSLNPKTLVLEPVLAEDFSISNNCKQATYKLRKNVYFHDSPIFKDGKGRMLNAHDVKACFDHLADISRENVIYFFLSQTIVGVKEYHNSIRSGNPLPEGISGVKVIDDYTITIDLIKPECSFFEQTANLNFAIYPKEVLGTSNGFDIKNLVGTGPFIFNSNTDSLLIFKRNNKYWKTDSLGYKLPYLDSVRFIYKNQLTNFKDKIDSYKNNKLDIIEDIMASDLDAMMETIGDEEIDYESDEILNLTLAVFNCTAPPFNNKWVRKAFSHAFNREKIVDYIYNGDNWYGDYGFTLSNHFYETPVKSNDYNKDSALYCLQKGGFNNFSELPEIRISIPEGFPKIMSIIRLFNDENGANIIIDTVKKEMGGYSYVYGQAFRGKYQMIIGRRFLSYPSPESMLKMFYSKYIPTDKATMSSINIYRYANDKFDNILEQSLIEKDKAKKEILLKKAERIILNDAATIPLLYKENNIIRQKGLKNVPLSPLGGYDYSMIYWE